MVNGFGEVCALRLAAVLPHVTRAPPRGYESDNVVRRGIG